MAETGPWIPAEAEGEVRRHAPATLRNRGPLAECLAAILPPAGRVLEVASGSGEHVVHFAERFPTIDWQPSDPDPAALASIAAWTKGLANVAAPVALDAAAADWPVGQADAVLCINMLHISPWDATAGLMAGAARLLGHGQPLVLYGPFVEQGVETAASNMAFDRSLRERDPRWGLRDVAEVTAAAVGVGLAFDRSVAMPANNLLLVYRKLG